MDFSPTIFIDQSDQFCPYLSYCKFSPPTQAPGRGRPIWTGTGVSTAVGLCLLCLQDSLRLEEGEPAQHTVPSQYRYSMLQLQNATVDKDFVIVQYWVSASYLRSLGGIVQ